MHPSTPLSLLLALCANRAALARPVVARDANNLNYNNHGSMTYYEVGLGSCGHDDSGKDEIENIVAMSPALMGAGEGCGRRVRIQGKDGQTVLATVRDKCMGCLPEELDVSSKVFKKVVGDLGVGRERVSWAFVGEE